MLAQTQMHIVTFIFVCIEIVIFFYLVIYRLARPDDKTTSLNIVLIFLLITYNVTGGLLPDTKLPGSFFVQNIIAYATGFITPCYFPYYVHRAFGLEKMKFHAYKGVFLYLMMPYLVFVIVFAASGSLDTAKNILILPVLYALWVIATLLKAIKFKYKNDFRSKESKEELSVLVLSITPWIGLPVITYFNLSQAAEASVTNAGFLLLLSLQVKRHIMQLRVEHERLIDSEMQLLNWNTNLQIEVDKRTKELEKINEQKTNTFVNLAHETKTPLTLINNYLEEYITSNGDSEELNIVKRNIDKLSSDIVNLFDLERFNKGFDIYNHDQVSDFSEILKDYLLLFKGYSKKRGITLHEKIENRAYIKADPVAINRIVKNLSENAIKFSNNNSNIEILLCCTEDKIIFSIKDFGIGIPMELQKKVFEPYYQISNQKTNIQGMGLGLPIVKKVVEDLYGEIEIKSDPQRTLGTTITVSLSRHFLKRDEIVSINLGGNIKINDIEILTLRETEHDIHKQTILLVEDNISMVNYLHLKLSGKYNVYIALNGNEALKKIKDIEVLPDLIISDVMMDKLDGYNLAKIISKNPNYNHIPFIFLSAKATKNDRVQGLTLGAIDYIQKPFSISELLQKVESVLLNSVKQKSAALTTALNAISASKNVHLQSGLDTFYQNCQLYHLTSREKDIAKLICEGFKYKEIGETLFIAERTVTKHVQNIFEKVQVSNKIELRNKMEV